MTVDALLNAIVGPAGSLVILVLLILAIVKLRVLVPGFYYEEAEKRIEMLDSENRKLSESITKMNNQNAELRVSLARFEEQITHMTEEVESLRSEVNRLRMSGEAS